MPRTQITMTVREWLMEAEARLRRFEVESPILEAQILAGHVLRTDRSWLFAHPDAEFNDLAGEVLLQRRGSGEPLAYIVGHREFFGRDFGVDPSVLIPRHETETLIEASLELFPFEGALVEPSQMRVLDLGTGSGILAITLKLERPDWELIASDISPEALSTASANARFHDAQVTFVLSDGFQSLLGENFDLIVSNPPYIGEEEELPIEVRSFEPSQALFAEGLGLAFYERLSQEGFAYLSDHGVMLVEIGFRQSDSVRRIFLESGWTLILERNDLSGVLRVLGFRYDFHCNPEHEK